MTNHATITLRDGPAATEPSGGVLLVPSVRRVMGWTALKLPGWQLALSVIWLDGLPPDHYYLRQRVRQPKRVRLPGGRLGRRRR